MAVVLSAFCLRIVITGVGSVLHMIQAELGLSNSMAGLLTTLPLLAFAAASPLVGRFGTRVGEGRAIGISLVLIAIGTIVRSLCGTVGLFLGTLLLGIGVAVGNVLIPAIIKSEYPEQVGIMTGIFTVAMSLAAALSLGVSVPMAEIPGFGWKGTLGIWVIIVIFTWVLWRRLRTLRLEQPQEQGERRNLLRSPVAWAVTVFFGINSMLFYIIIGWLPTILQSGGMNSTDAGLITSLFQLVGIPTSLLAPIWAGRCKDQRLVIVLASACNIVGVTMLILAQSQAMQIAAAILLGFSNGSNFSVGMALFGFRTNNAADAARLSGVAQSIGYVIAATGPSVMGWIYDLIPNWSICLIYLLIFTVFSLIAGIYAGADKKV